MSSSVTEEPGSDAQGDVRDAARCGDLNLPARPRRRPLVLTRAGLVCWTMPWKRAGRDVLTVTCKATCDLRPDAPAALREVGDPPFGDQRWGDAPTAPLRYPSDLVSYKPQADVVLIDAALAASDPARGAFTRFRFGHPGAQFDRQGEVGGVPFGPIAPESPERSRGLGSYDARWLAERWPYLPDDFDVLHDQAAPPPQRLAYLRGDEPFELGRLGADRAVLVGSLPGVRPCCLRCHREGGGLALRRVELCLDTVIIDADALTLWLLWRAVLSVSAPHAPEIDALYLTTEPLAAPRSDEQLGASLHAELSLMAQKAPAPGSARRVANDTGRAFREATAAP